MRANRENSICHDENANTATNAKLLDLERNNLPKKYDNQIVPSPKIEGGNRYANSVSPKTSMDIAVRYWEMRPRI